MTIVIQNLRVDYRVHQGSLNIIDIPYWSVSRGEQIAVFGPSGSGKSTLLHVLSGVITATQGRVEVCGANLMALTEIQRDRFRAHHVGYVFQNLNLLSGYTALENVLMGATFSPERPNRQAAESLLRTVGLADRMHHSPRQMSLGEQQRVAIARALIKRPELVLADEPTGSLDPRNTSQIVRLLRSACAAQRSTLILVTHEQSVIAEFEQRVAYAELNRAWRDVKVRHDPLVVDAIPFAIGHSFAGFRVNAIDDRFFTAFEYRPGKRFSFRSEEGGQGRAFQQGREAVAGWAASRALHLTLGSTFNPVHGVRSGDPVHMHDTFHFVGIMAPTGTPHDMAIYIPLNTFYTLEGHGAEVARMAVDPTHREISGAYLRLRRIRGGAMHPGVQELKYEINQSPDAQLVVPNEVVPQILNIIGWADRVIFLLGAMVVGLGISFLFVVLVTALREQRRDLAMLRRLGANRSVVFGLILSEALILSAAGTLLGMAAGHELVSIGSQYVARETGLLFSAEYLSSADNWVLPAMLLLGATAGLLPAVQAYRLNVLENLRALE